MGATKFYAINNSGRQRLPVDNIMDAYLYCLENSYYKNNPPTKITEERKIEFKFPEDFED